MLRTVSTTSGPAVCMVQRCFDTRAGAAAKRPDAIAHSTLPRQGLGWSPPKFSYILGIGGWGPQPAWLGCLPHGYPRRVRRARTNLARARRSR